jgi:hypothetical protein
MFVCPNTLYLPCLQGPTSFLFFLTVNQGCSSAFFYAAFAACWYLQTGGSEVERVMHNLAPGEEL